MSRQFTQSHGIQRVHIHMPNNIALHIYNYLELNTANSLLVENHVTVYNENRMHANIF